VRLLQSRALDVPPSRRVLGVGTEKALGEALAAFREHGGAAVRFLQGYGPTEATITCTMYRHDGRDLDGSRPLPIGRPLANTEIYVLDDAGEPVPVGMPGELCVGGVGLARGYLGRPDLTAECFVPHPLRPDARVYKTGDITRWEPDGQLVYVGRSDFQVKIRGFRVELGEIEAVLRAHPSVSEAVVLLREDPGEPRRLVAYLVTGPGTGDLASLEALCRARLPEYMVPAAFVRLDALPLTHNAKVDRAALPRPAAAAPGGPSRAARDELERTIAAAFAEVLGLPAVSLTTGFFDLGGDSLRAMIMLGRLEAALSRPIPLGQLFRTSSVEALAEHLRRHDPAGDDDEQPAVVRLKDGEGTPLFLAMGVHMYQELVRALTIPNPVYAVVQPVESAMVRRGEPLPSIRELARRNVELLRRHTPHGPYAIGGFSFGGFVAYEMAQLLEDAGEVVTVLALFDCILPRGRRPGLRIAASTYGHALMTGELQQRIAQRLRRSLRTLRPLREAHAAPAAEPTAAPTEAEQLRAFRDDAYTQGIVEYDRVVRPYRGSVALYRSLAFRKPVMPYHGFDALVTGPLTALDVPGDHDGLLRADNARRVARHLETLLAAPYFRHPRSLARAAAKQGMHR
jgi:thioesterase domain-containing protein/acyl carrier protein